MFKHPIWVENYRPKNIEECILPSNLDSFFKQIVKDGVVPNMTFSGTPGLGKTSVALTLAQQMGRSHLLINTSRDGLIDTVRTQISNFAGSASLDGNPKILILDEADNMNINGMQPALKGAIEEYSINCTFILTVNQRSKVMDAIISRCPEIDFHIPTEERMDLMKKFMKRCAFILEKEGVRFDPKALAAVVKNYYPDMRETIGVLQNYAKSGSIDSGILASLKDINIDNLVSSIKERNFKAVKEWVDTNNNAEPTLLFSKVYDSMYKLIKPESIPAAVLLLGKYQYQSAHVANQSINALAFCTEMMSEVEFV